jgi:hypothetical protein
VADEVDRPSSRRSSPGDAIANNGVQIALSAVVDGLAQAREIGHSVPDVFKISVVGG